MDRTQTEKFAGIAAANQYAIQLVIEHIARELGPQGFAFVKSIKAELLAAAPGIPAVQEPLKLLSEAIRIPASH